VSSSGGGRLLRLLVMLLIVLVLLMLVLMLVLVLVLVLMLMGLLAVPVLVVLRGGEVDDDDLSRGKNPACENPSLLAG